MLVRLALLAGCGGLLLPEYSQALGYPTQTHRIQSPDGFASTFFRIQQRGGSMRAGLPPVYLQHGLMESADSWVINEESQAIGLILANRGFDVWLGNSRGNKYSRPSEGPASGLFSFREVAELDLPAAMGYIRAATGRRVHYVGHSEGALVMNVALSRNLRAVEAAIGKYFALAPVAYIGHQESPLLLSFSQADYLERRDHEAFHSDGDPLLNNGGRLDMFREHGPSGTSLTNILHWREMAQTGRFQAFDYGARANLERYGRPVPPVWKPRTATLPTQRTSGFPSGCSSARWTRWPSARTSTDSGWSSARASGSSRRPTRPATRPSSGARTSAPGSTTSSSSSPRSDPLLICLRSGRTSVGTFGRRLLEPAGLGRVEEYVGGGADLGWISVQVLENVREQCLVERATLGGSHVLDGAEGPLQHL